MENSLDVDREPYVSTSAPTSPTKLAPLKIRASENESSDSSDPFHSSDNNLCNSPTTHSLTNRHKSHRSVKFPEDNAIVTGYHEAPDPFRYAEIENEIESVSNAYQEACKKQGIQPIATVLEQIKNFRSNRMRAQDLILRGEQLNSQQCEALEEILKRVLFRLIDLDSCNLDGDGASALFDMVEFYESASHLSIANNQSIGVTGWQALCRTMKKTACLEYLDLSNTGLNEQILLIMGRTIRVGSHLITLHLENAGLFGRRLAILVSSIKFNTSLRELYLGENKISAADCVQLANLLRGNSLLNVLDLRSNLIQDIGLEHICDGLAHQPSYNSVFDIFETGVKPSIYQNSGILILNLSDNQLTSQAMSRLSSTLPHCRSLIGLDLSENSLGDDGLLILKDGLIRSKTLKYLNLANTNITKDGANSLKQILTECPKLSKVNLSENNLGVWTIATIREVVKTNKSLIKVTVTLSEPCEEGDQLIEDIEHACAANKMNNNNSDELDEIINGYLKHDISIYYNGTNDANNNNNLASQPDDYGGADNSPGNQIKAALMRTTSLGSWEVPVKSGRFSVSPVSNVSEDEATSPTAIHHPDIQICVATERLEEESDADAFRESNEARACSSDDDNGSDLSQNETDQLSELPSRDMLMNMPRLMPPQRSFRRMSTPTISETVKPKPKVNLQLKLSGNLESLDLKSSLPLSPTFFAKFDFSDLSLLRLPPEVEELISTLPPNSDDIDSELIFQFEQQISCMATNPSTSTPYSHFVF